MLTDDELSMLEAIRTSGSLSRAAARLGKAPSTVSHAARQLESRFDALLFDGRRYRMELTPAGQLLANESRRLMADSERLNQRIRQIANGWEDRLWIVTDTPDAVCRRRRSAASAVRTRRFHCRRANRVNPTPCSRAGGPTVRGGR